ncbi:phage head closure protein [Alysiella crassa]|uniref:Bacteriophage head-tail adaptor n=1 Tax=Alysiella crassa TaxID=153491 RepID=A0A376BVD7_9NEIS|nr:phage head closure protein [Alysiella crassa]UOP05877.1 phage head closure protein [Alysiella crassa]SSY80304.1 Bacteriophage head-tail adaptor [Alysiella crassa]
MQAGSLKNRVEIWRFHAVQDETGANVQEWAFFLRLWANIRHVSGSQAIKADTQTESVKASIRIRFNEQIQSGMQVRYRGEIYQIDAVLHDYQHKDFTDLVCLKVE